MSKPASSQQPIKSADSVATDVDAPKLVACLLDGMRSLNREISTLLVGRLAIIQSNYNGQQYGSSRKSRKGDMVTIREAYVEGGMRSVIVFIDDERIGLRLDEVVLVEGEESR